ncbi:hypothetical protein MSAN_00752700 [Mycena sanguinolenta]|uniref:F-box domain-containing protein n=1 Tax=Mycena sanguinolenta TaxID=230812 RepID=A0A8H7DFI1_9AGAR|nr:hypothetical protein MSAN_00752700 [Mycena sanguinolenta]
MQMLRNLTKLTSLTIGPNMFVCLKYPRIFPPFSACFLPAFRNLVKLSAPVSYVRLFLMRRDPLPALRQLKLPPIDTAGAATYHHKNLHLHLPHIINQLRGLNHSVYPLPVTFCLGRKGEASPAKHIDMSLALDPKVADNLREITHLVLSDEFDSRIHPPSLCRWLRLFPALQQISWDNSGPASVATKDVPNLVREIFRACPTVETIFAQGVRYTPIEIIEESNNVSTAFVDLPAEVLLLIFAFLHRDELFSLSILCRRFHFLALPLFLERNFIENPSEMTNINFAAILGSEASILCALTIALFLPSIKRLVCLFPATHIHQRVDSIRRVTRLVRRLETIDNISLEFISDRCRLRDFGDSYSEERLWQACFSALRDLLEAVDSKSCTSLTIIGSPAMVASTLTAPSLPPPTMSSLTTISLNVGCSAAYSSWILSGLKDSPVASLKLTVTEVELAAANFPTSLTTLSLAGTYTPRAKVMKYLARHPHLKTLNLAGNLSQYFSEAAPDAVPAVQPLLQLHDLTASLSYISYFFLYAHDPPFPALKHLTILVDNLCNVGWALSSLIERVRECYPHPLTFALEITDLWNGRFLSDSVGFLTSMGGKWTHAARHIACLKCAMHFDLDSDGRMGVDSDLVQISLSWLGLFRGLRDVKIESLGRRGVHPPVAELVKFGNLIGEGLPSVHIAIQVDQRTVFER